MDMELLTVIEGGCNIHELRAAMAAVNRRIFTRGVEKYYERLCHRLGSARCREPN